MNNKNSLGDHLNCTSLKDSNNLFISFLFCSSVSSLSNMNYDFMYAENEIDLIKSNSTEVTISSLNISHLPIFTCLLSFYFQVYRSMYGTIQNLIRIRFSSVQLTQFGKFQHAKFSRAIFFN